MNYLKSKQAKIYILFIILAIIFSTFIFSITRKQSIHNATINDLNNVQSIGNILSKQIYTYVQTFNIDNVESLKGHIPNVGDTRIKELKKKYK